MTPDPTSIQLTASYANAMFSTPSEQTLTQEQISRAEPAKPEFIALGEEEGRKQLWGIQNEEAVNEDESETQAMSGSASIISQDGTGTANFRVIASTDPTHRQQGQAALLAAAHAIQQELSSDAFTGSGLDAEQQAGTLELVYQAQAEKTAALQKPPAIHIIPNDGKLPGLYAMSTMEPAAEVRSTLINVDA